MDQKKERNEKTFIWQDIKLSTVYGRIRPESASGPYHMHTQYEMFFFKKGKGCIVTESGKINISRNTLVIIPPNTSHHMMLDDPDEVKGMTVRFHYKKISDRRRQNTEQLYAFFANSMPAQNHFLVLKDKYFSRLYNEFFTESEATPVLASSLIKHMLEGLFLQILRLIHSPQKLGEQVPIYSYTTIALSSDSIIATSIDDFMNSPECTLSSLAEHLKMSPRNVQRILRKTYGQTFTERLAEVRLTQAAHLMKTTELSMIEIANRCNYNKYDSFRKAFITMHGISPTQYRKSNK